MKCQSGQQEIRNQEAEEEPIQKQSVKYINDAQKTKNKERRLQIKLKGTILETKGGA